MTHPSWVEVTVHDASLDLGDNTMIAGREVDSRHHGNTDSDGFALGGHEDNLLIDLDVSLISQKTGNHELGTVADGVDSAVLDDDTLVADEQ